MTKIQENRKENKKIIGRNVFVNVNNGERFLTIEEIKGRNRYSVIVENGDTENCYFAIVMMVLSLCLRLLIRRIKLP